jgi:hypothetical protein
MKKKKSDGRRPQNIKSGIIYKALPQVLDFSWGNQTKIECCLKWRQSQMEDNLTISMWKYQEQLIGSYSNLRLKPKLPNHSQKGVSQKPINGSYSYVNLMEI